MKLYYIENFRLPTEKAHGIQIMKTCEALSELVEEVNLLVPTRNNFIDADPFDYYGIGRVFEVVKLKTYDPDWLLSFPSGIYTKVQGSLFAFKIFRYFSNRTIKQQDSQAYTRNEYLLPILQGIFDKVTWEAHDLPAKQSYYVKYWKRCHKIVAITHGLKMELVNLGIPDEKIIVAPDGVDINKFSVKYSKSEIREELGLPLNKKIIMYTGHLYEWKGADLLLKAASSKLGGLRGAQFVFVGGTKPDTKDFRKKAEGLKNVSVLGHRPHLDIPKYLAAADILVLPNSAKTKISKTYTSPIKLFEYMAAGRPIVASGLPSIKEVLDESRAIFFDPDNADNLAKALGKVLSDPTWATKIAAEAKDWAGQYDWSSRAEKIYNFIQALPETA